MGEPINASRTEIWTSVEGTGPKSCSSRGWATPRAVAGTGDGLSERCR